MTPWPLSPHSWHRHCARCFGDTLTSRVTLGVSDSASNLKNGLIITTSSLVSIHDDYFSSVLVFPAILSIPQQHPLGLMSLFLS